MYLTELSKMQRKQWNSELKSGGVRWFRTKINSKNVNFPALSILGTSTAQKGPINAICSREVAGIAN